MSFQDSGLTIRKRHATGYTEQLQQYSSPGERFGGMGPSGGCRDEELGAQARSTPAKVGSPEVEGTRACLQCVSGLALHHTLIMYPTHLQGLG